MGSYQDISNMVCMNSMIWHIGRASSTGFLSYIIFNQNTMQWPHSFFLVCWQHVRADTQELADFKPKWLVKTTPFFCHEMIIYTPFFAFPPLTHCRTL